MPGLLLPAFSDGFMACRFNRSIPAHSIPVPPSLRGLSSHHQSHGPLSSFPGGLLLRPPYRYGLHAAQTGFLLTGSCGYFPTGVPGVFAFPARREDNIYVYEFYVNKNFIYVYIEQKKPAGTKQHRRSRPAGHKKAPHEEGRGRVMESNEVKMVGESGVEEFAYVLGSGQFNPECPDALTRMVV